MRNILLLCCIVFACFSCDKDEDIQAYKPSDVEYSSDEIDQYFQENFQDKYGCAIRWKWVDRYVDISYVVAPAKREVAIPVGDMLRKYWIEPFILESKASGDFIRKNFPPEIVFVGSSLRNADGTVTLGYADAGVRITLTELNQYDINNKDWIVRQLHTIHHEFSHIVHQTYQMPVGFNKITQDNYTGNAWNDIYAKAQNDLVEQGLENPTQAQIDSLAQEVAIMKGMLTPYGTSSEFEDFAEMVSIYLLTPPAHFSELYLAPDPRRPYLNEGKAFIAKKIEMIINYYQSNFSIDFNHLREIIDSRLSKIGQPDNN